MVRAERIELSSLAWKAGILAVIRRPHNSHYSKKPSLFQAFLLDFAFRSAYGNI